MKLTERHIFTNRKDFNKICHLSKNLYNYTNYILRQSYIKSGKLPREYDINKQLAKENQIDFRALPSNTSQQIINLLYKNWKSYFKAIKEYKIHPDKFKSKPKLPKYKKKDGKNIVIFTNQQCRIKDDGYIHFPKKANIDKIKTKISNDDLCQVRIIPQASCYVLEVIYNKEEDNSYDLDDNLYLGIDLGINNFISCISNTDNDPLLLKGKVIKSINQYYNKKKSILMSYIDDKGKSNRLDKLTFKRNNKINDYLHKSSRFIINYCLEHKIKNIVIGYNKGWKQDINIGKINNQKFVSIPFFKLINQIKYKAKLVGINVQTINESYTSKCDSLSLEEIRHHDKYSGRRKKRGLFQSGIDKLINADINGAINILRKVIGDGFVKNLLDRGYAFNPLTINSL